MSSEERNDLMELTALGTRELADGRPHDALISFERALELVEDGDLTTRGVVLLEAGRTRASIDRLDPRARELFEEARQLGSDVLGEQGMDFIDKVLSMLPVMTDEQRAKLALITDQSQRDSLIDALCSGEDIPDYAWTPIPPMSEKQRAVIHELLEQIRDEHGEEGIAIALDPDLFADEDDE